MTFDDLIIESAKSLANASSALIKAASEAQKELVRQGKIQKTTLKGSTEGQWSEGLVSAAKMVASATQSLCEAANALVLGEGEEENLIAAAKQVSTSTNQLFLAFQVWKELNKNQEKPLFIPGQGWHQLRGHGQAEDGQERHQECHRLPGQGGPGLDQARGGSACYHKGRHL